MVETVPTIKCHSLMSSVLDARKSSDSPAGDCEARIPFAQTAYVTPVVCRVS